MAAWTGINLTTDRAQPRDAWLPSCRRLLVRPAQPKRNIIKIKASSIKGYKSSVLLVPIVDESEIVLHTFHGKKGITPVEKEIGRHTEFHRYISRKKKKCPSTWSMDVKMSPEKSQYCGVSLVQITKEYYNHFHTNFKWTSQYPNIKNNLSHLGFKPETSALYPAIFSI